MPDPATQPTHEPRAPHRDAVKRIARHLLGEDIVNIRAALESFPNGYTVVPKAAASGDAARTLRAMLRAHRNLAPPCAIEEALLDRALAEAASPAALDGRLPFRDELMESEHEVATRLHRYLWGDTPHDVEPADGSDCQVCYDEVAGLFWHTITPAVEAAYSPARLSRSAGEQGR